ncbi:MAG: hypothetical protein LBT21_06350 [Oscillospiraceae bacterium]|jgi:hypothetical protein|nr:hypothetical protein [Oscillospiraceae bacterium]
MDLLAEIIIGALAFAGTVVGAIIGARRNLSVLEEKLNLEVERIRADITRLEIKQDRHNNAIERLTRAEESTKSAHKRIDKIEGGKK